MGKYKFTDSNGNFYWIEFNSVDEAGGMLMYTDYVF